MIRSFNFEVLPEIKHLVETEECEVTARTHVDSLRGNYRSYRSLGGRRYKQMAIDKTREAVADWYGSGRNHRKVGLYLLKDMPQVRTYITINSLEDLRLVLSLYPNIALAANGFTEVDDE